MVRILCSVPLHNYWPQILFGLVTLWLGICFGLSRMGWRAFAERLGKPPRLSSETMRKRRKAEGWREEVLVEVVQFGRFCTYGQLVKAVLGREGIHLRARLPMPFHAPFTVPWAWVRGVEKEGGTATWDAPPRYRVEVETPAPDEAGGKRLQMRLWLSATEEVGRGLGAVREIRDERKGLETEGGRSETQKAQGGWGD